MKIEKLYRSKELLKAQTPKELNQQARIDRVAGKNVKKSKWHRIKSTASRLEDKSPVDIEKEVVRGNFLERARYGLE